MRHRLRRRGIVPFVFAVLLTVAAGLSLAEEHGWEQAEAPAAGPQAAPPPDPSSPASSPAAHRQAERPGVGSRALTGHNDVEPAVHDVQPAVNEQLQ